MLYYLVGCLFFVAGAIYANVIYRLMLKHKKEGKPRSTETAYLTADDKQKIRFANLLIAASIITFFIDICLNKGA